MKKALTALFISLGLLTAAGAQTATPADAPMSMQTPAKAKVKPAKKAKKMHKVKKAKKAAM